LQTGVHGENAVQVGQRILNTFGSLAGIAPADFDLMCAEHGFGQAKAAQIKAAIELGNRLQPESSEERHPVNRPANAAALV